MDTLNSLQKHIPTTHLTFQPPPPPLFPSTPIRILGALLPNCSPAIFRKIPVSVPINKIYQYTFCCGAIVFCLFYLSLSTPCEFSIFLKINTKIKTKV